MVKKLALHLLVCMIAIFGLSQLAFAHAHLLSSTPAAGGTVQGPAIAIDLKFNSRVDSSRSQLDLVLPDGKVESLKISAPSDAEFAAHSTLAPGKYTIRWQALSTDGHITRGEIPFNVK
jgi:copper resistance protein C